MIRFTYTYHQGYLTRRLVQATTIILLVLSLYSCTERIDIKIDEDFQKLAVEAYVTPAPEAQFVKLTKTSGYFSQEAPGAVSEAVVTVNNGADTYQWDESTDKPGYYYPPDDFDIIVENDYKLTIDLKAEIGGATHYESTAYMPRFGAIIDSIRVIWRGEFDRWIIKLYAYEPPGPDYYMFNALKDGELITDSISRVGITDDKLVDGIYIPGIYTLFFYEDELAIGDTVTLITSSITSDYYRYISEVQTELFPKVPIFSGPPANVRSNISNGAVGYFATFVSDTTTNIIDGSGIWEK